MYIYFVKFQYAFFAKKRTRCFAMNNGIASLKRKRPFFLGRFSRRNSGIRGSRGITEEGKEKERRGRLFETDLRIYEPRHRLPVTLALREI